MKTAHQLAHELRYQRAKKSDGHMTMGQKLRGCREEFQLYQEEAAKELGFHTQRLSLLENDKANPTLKTLVKLAAFYGLSLDDLAGYMVEAERQNSK